eukprot:8599200-Karenia_brevis.AAC.1
MCIRDSFNAAISACEKGWQWQRVAPLSDEKRQWGLLLEAISSNAAISACDKGLQWQCLAPLFEEVRTRRACSLTSSASYAAISVCELRGTVAAKKHATEVDSHHIIIKKNYDDGDDDNGDDDD